MFKYFTNIGYLESKLSVNHTSLLKKYIKNRSKKPKTTLAGNLNSSFQLKDTDNKFFNKVIKPNINEHIHEFGSCTPSILTKDCKFVLKDLWVNFQKKYEFNPIHNHDGAYSFVIWIQIPSSFKEEIKLPFIKNSNSKCPNTFQFIYTNSLSNIVTQSYHLDSSYEGTMLFFPAKLDHLVYPFYLSNKYRISISGNVSLDPEQLLPAGAVPYPEQLL